MFIQSWRKYLPVIVILMKRSATGEQILDMNHTDFVRAAGGKKIKLSFSTITLENGRVDNPANHPALVTDLIKELQENKVARQLMQDHQFSFRMNMNCQLTIKNITEILAN